MLILLTLVVYVKVLRFHSVVRWILTKRNLFLKFVKYSCYVLSSTHPVFHVPGAAGVRNLINFVFPFDVHVTVHHDKFVY
jgi:hypothetical protein